MEVLKLVMRILLIQQKVPIGSQVTFTLKTGEKISGSLAELGKDYITLDVANRQKTILADAILMFDIEGQNNDVEITNSILVYPESTESDPQQKETPDRPLDENIESTESDPQQKETPDRPLDENIESTESDPQQKETPDRPLDENIESTESDPQQKETPDRPLDENIESTESDPQQVSKYIEDIIHLFDNKISVSKIELVSPDLTFTTFTQELHNWQNTDVAAKLVQIKNKYENAQKINELGAQFGRIQDLVLEIDSLVKQFPNAPTLKRVLAYFHSISLNWEKAVHNYQIAAIHSKDVSDWFNLAVSALKLDREDLACYSLRHFFKTASPNDNLNTWFVFVCLLIKFNNLPAFCELCEIHKHVNVEEDIKVLLDTAIYLLMNKNSDEAVTKIIQGQLVEDSTVSLLGKACKGLEGNPHETYHRFLDIMNVITTVDGEELYKEAEVAETIEKNLEKSQHLYQECIRRNIQPDNAIKNLAMVLVRLERPTEAVHLLKNKSLQEIDKQGLDNTLITVYSAAKQYEKVINHLKIILKQTKNEEKKAQIYWQIASAYIKLGDYTNAEGQFLEVLKLRPDNVAVRRSRAFCFSHQKRFNKAEEILNQIQETSPDVKTAELLEAVEQAKKPGEFILDDRFIEIETELSYLSVDLSEFAHFFLARCTFEGIPTGRVSNGKYTGSENEAGDDIQTLEDIAKQLGTKSPRDRSNYYLSAARIYVDVGENHNFFYRNLCRSFASRGDDAASENRNLDTVQEWYCEALAIHDKNRDRNEEEEQDAVNSLIRYLYSILGHANIDLSTELPSIDQVIKSVVNDHEDTVRVFDSIANLVLHSRYAANKVMEHLYSDEFLREISLEYLKEVEISVPNKVERFDDFVRPWNELRNVKFNNARTISTNLRLLEHFELTTAWLEDNIRLTSDLRSLLFFELDQHRIDELQGILQSTLELCKQVTFEERERLCIQLRNHCQNLFKAIEESPTRLSVETVYPITEVIQKKIDTYLEGLYETSKPQLKLRLAVASYTPDTDRKIDIHIAVENEKERSPAESLELVIEKNQAFFEVIETNIKQDESLRGGDQSILVVPLYLTHDALRSGAFSLPIYAQYSTRTGEQLKTPVQNLSIHLSSKDKFKPIKNPYAQYAEGTIVADANMFYGREVLIQNIAQAIQESRSQSKCVLVFGQKRSGKSSVLYHLKKSLEKDPELLILDLGNMSTLLDQHAHTSLLHQFLNGILRGLKRAIRQKQREGYSSLELAIPDREFYEHPTPLQLFEDSFVRLKDLTDNHTGQEDWRGIRVVLLIDEFQYIYNPIIEGKFPDSFMQNWKALLQANYFSAVLVGQDMMPKFKLRFPNEFGTAQDERVTYLKKEDARKLIDEPIRIGGIQGESRYREQAIERILDLTAGSPFYIQILCSRLVEHMNAKHTPQVTEAHIEQVKEELISGVNAFDLDKFDNLINSGDTSEDAISDEDALKVLKVIADNSSIGPCHRDRIICETHLPVDTILEDLEKRDVVERRDQSYQIQVGLFKEWLVTNG